MIVESILIIVFLICVLITIKSSSVSKDQKTEEVKEGRELKAGKIPRRIQVANIRQIKQAREVKENAEKEQEVLRFENEKSQFRNEKNMHYLQVGKEKLESEKKQFKFEIQKVGLENYIKEISYEIKLKENRIKDLFKQLKYSKKDFSIEKDQTIIELVKKEVQQTIKHQAQLHLLKSFELDQKLKDGMMRVQHMDYMNKENKVFNENKIMLDQMNIVELGYNMNKKIRDKREVYSELKDRVVYIRDLVKEEQKLLADIQHRKWNIEGE